MAILAPGDTEFELSLFGPGYGECIVIHCGFGQYVIVDSCIDHSSRVPASLKYLRDINVDPATAVRLIVATHWHDDHVRGLASTLKACTSATFACPAALGTQEFMSLVARYSRSASLESTGVDEFRDVFDELRRRKESSGKDLRPEYAIENRLLWESVASEQKVSVTAISPSDKSLENALACIGKLLPAADAGKLRVTPQGPNHAAVVLKIDVGAISVLLGSDLEVTTSTADGWDRAAEVLSSKGRSRVFKVAHHGSSNGHHDGIWNGSLEKDSIAVLTPFQNGNVSLPRDADLQRLTGLSEYVFLTCIPKLMEKKLQNRAADEIVKSVTRSPLMSQLPGSGWIRVRSDFRRTDSEWEIKPFGAAVRVTEGGRSAERGHAYVA